jgi:hypothetical protein
MNEKLQDGWKVEKWENQVTCSSIVQPKLELFNALQLQWMFPCESVVEVPKEKHGFNFSSPRKF